MVGARARASFEIFSPYSFSHLKIPESSHRELELQII
jgi:hypothetical protein